MKRYICQYHICKVVLVDGRHTETQLSPKLCGFQPHFCLWFGLDKNKSTLFNVRERKVVVLIKWIETC